MPRLIPCTTEDLDKLLALARDAFIDAFAHLNTKETMDAYVAATFTPEQFKTQLEAPGSHFFFLYDADVLRGYLKLNEPGAQSDLDDPDALEIERIYVFGDGKGRGYGRFMAEQAEIFARARGLGGIWLGVWEKNPAAIAFYERLGFIRAGEHVFVMGEERQTDYIMRKSLL